MSGTSTRFAKDMKGVTPILSDVAPAETMKRGDGAHSGNPHVRKSVAAGNPQHVAWAFERPNGGRGFGFTGGHNHPNWGNDDYRKTVLNAIVWVAKAEVPAAGVPSKLTEKDLYANLDNKGRKPKPRSNPGPKAGSGFTSKSPNRSCRPRSSPRPSWRQPSPPILRVPGTAPRGDRWRQRLWL